MLIKFKTITTIVAILFLGLCATLLFAPALLAWLFQIDQTISSDFMGRRAAMLFLGLGTLAILSRHSLMRETQRVVAAAIFVAMAGLVLLGLYEFTVGTAGVGIFLAIVTEVIICALYAPIVRGLK